MSERVVCPTCRGTGAVGGWSSGFLCPQCWGRGTVTPGPRRSRGPFQHILEAFDRAVKP